MNNILYQRIIIAPQGNYKYSILQIIPIRNIITVKITIFLIFLGGVKIPQQLTSLINTHSEKQ